ncbi:MAG: isoamylase [Roseiflexaceae bacterium]|nr:isoamylase [Roseiflexaceae bacterium]
MALCAVVVSYSMLSRESASWYQPSAWERSEGSPAPLGPTWVPAGEGYNFALFSRHATSVTLLIYSADDFVNPIYRHHLDPRRNKTHHVWHCWVPAAAIPGGRYYAYRVDGPRAPEEGHRFDPTKIVLDPYAPEVFFPPNYCREAAMRPGPNDGRAPLGVLPRREPPYDWEDDVRPYHTHDLIVYELHVRGFTARANSGVAPEERGTFLGLIRKIPYLVELGVTAVELLPVHQFDPQEGNYWGYMTLNFFAPHKGYAVHDPHREFREMVKAMHAAGIEVWLDVVYNHTSEGDERGPAYCYRLIDNRSYYLLTPDRRQYINASGCGNTLRCADPAVRTLIIDSLTTWIQSMHVDGFRFDLASILARDDDGSINHEDPALIHEISMLGQRYGVRLIAEAWDISAYLLGRAFPGMTWRQWNGKFRDDVRAFVRGDPGKVGDLMCRLYGSDDLFPDTLADSYRPTQSVNFVTSHDGFCLYDLVSYNHKHNLANGHQNTDGADQNFSWNCGWEGDENVPPDVLALRRRQARNLFTLLMLANGTPMFVAGDEFLNTQRGNNNPYNQDNEITWLDWDLLERNRDMFRFVKTLIAFRKAHPSIHRSRFWRDDVHWYGVNGPPDTSYNSHAVAYCLRGVSVGDCDLYVMINGYWKDLVFTIQEQAPGGWWRVIDTARPSPDDIREPGQEVQVCQPYYVVSARSIVVLRSRTTQEMLQALHEPRT